MDSWPAWARLVAGLGFPIAVAVWLMVVISPQVDRTAVAVQQHLNETRQILPLLRQICRNGAKTEWQAQLCDQP